MLTGSVAVRGYHLGKEGTDAYSSFSDFTELSTAIKKPVKQSKRRNLTGIGRFVGQSCTIKTGSV